MVNGAILCNNDGYMYEDIKKQQDGRLFLKYNDNK